MWLDPGTVLKSITSSKIGAVTNNVPLSAESFEIGIELKIPLTFLVNHLLSLRLQYGLQTIHGRKAASIDDRLSSNVNCALQCLCQRNRVHWTHHLINVRVDGEEDLW